MKAIRNIATILLLSTGVLHVFLFIQEPRATGSAAVLVFGIIYFIIGIILFLKMKYSHFLGIIVPLIGIIFGLVAFDLGDMSPLMKVLGIIETAIIILCSILVRESRKKAL